MNALYGIAIVSSLQYALFHDMSYCLIYFMCVLVWTAFIIKTKDHRANTKRKTLMQATWGGKFYFKSKIF